jgi:hypothetical protein
VTSKPAHCYAWATREGANDPDKPSDAYNDILFYLAYIWFLDESLMHFNLNYLTLGEAVGKEAIQRKMQNLFTVGLSKDN